ncbi:hypothetical protein ACFLXE_06060 [Chloroflexota bacterium]
MQICYAGYKPQATDVIEPKGFKTCEQLRGRLINCWWGKGEW